MNAKVKTVGALAGCVALASGAMMGVAPAIADNAPAPEAYVNVHAGELQQATQQKAVLGQFSFSQEIVSGIETFARGAATLCDSTIDKSFHRGPVLIDVNGESVSVSELAEKGGSGVYLLACACASNVASGGAIANANVEGVTLETLMEAVES